MITLLWIIKINQPFWKGADQTMWQDDWCLSVVIAIETILIDSILIHFIIRLI